MIRFQWWWAFAALPLPLLVRYVMPPAGDRDAALRTPFLEDFEEFVRSEPTRFRSWWSLVLAILAWALLVTATARPQWVGEPIELPASGRDLITFGLDGDLVEQRDEQDSQRGGSGRSRGQALVAALTKHARRDRPVLLRSVDGLAPANSRLGSTLRSAGFVAARDGYIFRSSSSETSAGVRGTRA